MATPPDRPSEQAGNKCLEGVVERITYQDEESGYTVARFLPDKPRRTSGGDGPGQAPTPPAYMGEDHLVTVVGTLPGVVAGEALALRGFWQRHSKHGWQFMVQSYRSILPATAQGLRRYLGSGLIKGIGPRTAEKIVARFDLETLDVLERQPERLLEVAGLGKLRMQRITTAWQEHKAINEVMLCLQELSVSTSLAVRIYKTYQDAAVTIVKNEPYRLARDVWGIGFKTADKIAQALGYTPDHPERIKAGVLFALSEASDNGGHTYLPRQELAKRAADLLGATSDQAEEAITGLIQESGVQVESLIAYLDGRVTMEPVRMSATQTADALSKEERETNEIQTRC